MSEILGTHGYVEGCYLEAPAPVPIPGINLFRNAELFVNDTRNKVALVAINLIRDGVTTITVATPVKMVFKYFDKNMITQRKEVRDFIINVPDYKFNTVLSLPKQRDIIEEIHGTTKSIYEVGAHNSEPDWQYQGTYKDAFKVHAKFIKDMEIVV